MRQYRSKIWAMGLAVGLLLLTVSAVYADGGTIVLTGAEEVTWTNDAAFTFEAKTLTGAAVTSSTDDAGDSCTWGLVDGRGSGAGWHITVSSSDLTGLEDSTSGAVTLTLTDSTTPAYNQFGLTVQIAADDVTVMTEAVGSMPTTGLTLGAATADGLTSSDMTVLTAPVDQGMGGYDIDPLFTIYLPAGSYAGTGTLTLTVTQADAPPA